MGRGKVTPVLQIDRKVTVPADEGCEFSPSCLDCPLPRCRYDDPDWFRRWLTQQRDRQVLEASHQHKLSIRELADRYSVTERTISRMLQRARSEAVG
jgi:sigma-70-like protein